MVLVIGLLGCTGKTGGKSSGRDSGTDDTAADGGGGGWLEIDGGPRCAVDDGALLGFCGESASTFWADGSTDFAEAPCAESLSATVWMAPGTWAGGEAHALGGDSTALADGEADVWFDHGDANWVATGGTATAVELGVDSVRVRFESDATVDFLTREEPGPGVRGEVWCTLSDG